MTNNKIVIAIIDYGMGNVQSVLNAFSFIGGCKPIITEDCNEIQQADALILPGVGAFEDAMKELKNRKLIEILNNEVQIKKKPILGICLGMQLLFQESEENGHHEGLGWLDGKVKKFNLPPGFRVPHIGWNNLKFTINNQLFEEIKYDKNFYFVHSYHTITNDNNVIALSNYGDDFVAGVQKDNIYGTQFHPEKSHLTGLKLIDNFCNLK